MMQQPFIQSLDLDTRRTDQDLNDSNFTLNFHGPIYLMTPPYSNVQLKSKTIILFLCSLQPNYFDFQLTSSSIRAKDEKNLKVRLKLMKKVQIKLFQNLFQLMWEFILHSNTQHLNCRKI